MSTATKPFSRSDRARFSRVVGLILLIAAPSLAFGNNYQTTKILKQSDYVDSLRAAGEHVDSAALASAAYHASFVRESHSNRWRPTGYAGLGTAGAVLGIGLLVLGMRNRTD